VDISAFVEVVLKAMKSISVAAEIGSAVVEIIFADATPVLPGTRVLFMVERVVFSRVKLAFVTGLIRSSSTTRRNRGSSQFIAGSRTPQAESGAENPALSFAPQLEVARWERVCHEGCGM
jgi:hypothetical protein